MTPATTTSAIRRVTKPTEPPRRFTSVKPRRKTFPIVTMASLLAIAYLLHLPIHNYSDSASIARVKIPLDAFSHYSDNASVPHTHVSADDHQISQIQTDVGSPLRGQPGKCLKHILYDKPVKTGSTAIMFAVREFLKETGQHDKACGASGPLSCVERAQSICNGTYDVSDYFSIIGHFQYGSKKLVQCLRPHYYIATSIRDPYQRRKSAYLWNRTLNGTHFSIPHTASFSEFMNRLPRCQLYHYYDGRGMDCDVGVSLEERVQDILDRVDEVIDVYDKAVGPLHKLISGYMARENESIKLQEDEFVEDFDKDTLKEEQMLYDRLREKRLRTPDVNRLPC